MAEPHVALDVVDSASYCGPAPLPLDLATRWNLDPWLLLALLAAALLAGLRWRAARDLKPLAAVAVLAVVFVSPLCALAVALFSARTVHHLLLFVAVAPLLAWSLPVGAGRRLAVAPALAVSSAVLWAWHWPPLYAWALADTAAYWLMQASLLAAALAYWRVIAGAAAAPAALPAALAGIAAGAGQMGLLGAVLTFADRPLYTPHLASTAPWGLTPLADQQLAGLVMWVPALLPYAAVGLLLLRARWRALEGGGLASEARASAGW